MKRYCPFCKKETKHDKFKEAVGGGRASVAERVLLGLITLGFNEMSTQTMIECRKCGCTRKD